MLFTLFVFSVCGQQSVTLSNGEWPPYLSENLPEYGFASYIVSEAFATQGVEVNYVFRPWNRAYAEAENGTVDGTLIWTRTAEREPIFHISDTIIRGETVFFHLSNYNFDWNVFADLTNYRIGGTLGYQYSFQDYPGVNIDRAPDDVTNFRKLLSQRIDVYESDKYAGFAILNENFSQAEVARIVTHPLPTSVAEYTVLFTRANSNGQRMNEIFNRGLAELKRSGRYDEIIQAFQRGEFQ